MVVVVENVVAADCSMVHAVDNSEEVVLGEDVADDAGSAGTVAVDSKVSAGTEAAARSASVNSLRRR